MTRRSSSPFPASPSRGGSHSEASHGHGQVHSQGHSQGHGQGHGSGRPRSHSQAHGHPHAHGRRSHGSSGGNDRTYAHTNGTGSSNGTHAHGTQSPHDRERERERSAKRPKIFRACAACVTSKTRCEDVNADGCALCRKRGRVCSLAAIASALEASTGGAGPSEPRDETRNRAASSASLPRDRDWHASPAVPATTIEELQLRLAEAERRVARTESAMMDLEAQLHRRRSRSGSRGSRSGSAERRRRDGGHDADEVQLAGPLRFATPLLYRLDESMFSVGSTRVYPDPVARGVVPASHVELAWHAFKARISSLLPLPPFLAVSTPVPVHGFVVLAALAHVPSQQYAAQIEGLVNESVLMAMSGAANVDVMLALLVLSLAPYPPDTDISERGAPCTPSAYRLISLAYQMGQSLGFEPLAEAALAKGPDLNIEWYAEQLWNLQLWTAIVNRFAILSLINGQMARLPARSAHRLPRLHRDTLEMCNRHLKAEADVIDMFEPVALALSSLEHVESYNLDSLRGLQGVWKRATEGVKEFIASEHQPLAIQRDAVCIEFALGMRIASLTTWIPSPLKDARELALPCLSFFPAIMTQMLDIAAGKGLSGAGNDCACPTYTIMLACAALICFRRAVQFVRIAYHNGSLIDAGRLDAAERHLVSLARAPRFFITEANKLLAELPYPETWNGAAYPDVHEASHGQCVAGQGLTQNVHPNGMPDAAAAATTAIPLPIEFDIMNWDFSFLYPDIPFQGILEPQQDRGAEGHQQHQQHQAHH